MSLGLRLGLGARTRGGAAPLPPTDFAISADDVDENAALGTVVGTMSATDPDGGECTFAVITDSRGWFTSDDDNLVVDGVPDHETAATHEVTVRVTGSQGGILDVPVTITINDVAEDPPEEPPGDVIVDDPGNFDVQPTVVEIDAAIAFHGKKKANGSVAKILMSIGQLQAGHQYTFTYTPDFSRLANHGLGVMVAFGLRTGNDFRLVGLKGNGVDDVNVYEVVGDNLWNQTSGFTEIDGGAATHGSLAGPNQIRLRVSADGETYTFYTGSGATYVAEITDQDPTPFSSVTAANEAGIAIFLPANDAGSFRIDGVLIDQAYDQHFASVVFLSGFEGSDGSTTFTDEKNGRTITVNGNAQIDTAQAKFGASSVLLDGTGDYATLADNNDWTFTGQFTIEGFIRFSDALANGTYTMLSQYGSAGARSWRAWLNEGTSTRVLQFAFSTDGSAVAATMQSVTGTHIVAGDAWNHWAVDRDGSGVIRLYVNGVMADSETNATAFFAAAKTLEIGAQATGTLAWNGWQDEVRITKGVARYASDSGFTAPTKAFPRV